MANIRNRFSFKEIYLMLISIIHSGLFFQYLDHLHTGLSNLNFHAISFFVFDFCIFLKILQTQILAAIRFDARWKLKFYDIIIVFILAGLEYFLFGFLDDLIIYQDKIYLYMIFISIFGIIGYIITFLSVIKRSEKEYIQEKKIQGTNIAVLLIAILTFFITYLTKNQICHSIANYFISLLLLLNIYVSLKLSRFL